MKIITINNLLDQKDKLYQRYRLLLCLLALSSAMTVMSSGCGGSSNHSQNGADESSTNSGTTTGGSSSSGTFTVGGYTGLVDFASVSVKDNIYFSIGTVGDKIADYGLYYELEPFYAPTTYYPAQTNDAGNLLSVNSNGTFSNSAPDGQGGTFTITGTVSADQITGTVSDTGSSNFPAYNLPYVAAYSPTPNSALVKVQKRL